MQDALPYTTLPIYSGLGQAPNMVDCIPGGLVDGFYCQMVPKIQLVAHVAGIVDCNCFENDCNVPTELTSYT